MSMTLTQFEDLLDRYGSDMSLWPKADAERSQTLLTTSIAAQSLMAEAKALDETLGAYSVAPPDAAFEARLLDLAPKPPEQTRKPKRPAFGWFNLRGLSIGASALACAALGFTLGVSSLNALYTDANAEAFMIASYDTYADTSWFGDEG